MWASDEGGEGKREGTKVRREGERRREREGGREGEGEGERGRGRKGVREGRSERVLLLLQKILQHWASEGVFYIILYRRFCLVPIH